MLKLRGGKSRDVCLHQLAWSDRKGGLGAEGGIQMSCLGAHQGSKASASWRV